MPLQFADLWTSLTNGNSTMLIFWGAVVLMSAVTTGSWAAVHWRKIELDAQLTRDMIERGMSAEEI
jgi:hypothetical protein